MDTVECLVKKGADINIKDDGGVSILVRLQCTLIHLIPNTVDA